jgi:hypothetical protein
MKSINYCAEGHLCLLTNGGLKALWEISDGGRYKRNKILRTVFHKKGW